MKYSILWFLANSIHLIANSLILFNLLVNKTSSGISLKSQYLLLLVYLTRYNKNKLLYSDFIGYFVMIAYTLSTVVTIILTKFVYKSEKDRKKDTFHIIIIIALSMILTLFTEQANEYCRILDTLSRWLDSMAFFPQVLLLGRSTNFNKITLKYMFFMTIFNLFYVLDWLYALILNDKDIGFIFWLTSIFQFLIHSDFLFLYIKSRIKQQEFQLPY